MKTLPYPCACVSLALAGCLRYTKGMTHLSYPVSQGVDTAQQLDFVREAFGLSETELGELFKVTRQATSQWRERGLPPERSAQVDRVVELAQFLQRRLVPQRIPEIVRTPAKSLGGQPILAVLREHGPLPIFNYVLGLAAYANS
jgi:hypothetical protein